jgi:hypothetical protein
MFKKVAKNFGYFCILSKNCFYNLSKKLPKINNRSLCENTPNLVTLVGYAKKTNHFILTEWVLGLIVDDRISLNHFLESWEETIQLLENFEEKD